MTSEPAPYDVSPSVHHRRLMEQTTPAMAFNAADPDGWRRRLRATVADLLGRRPDARPALNVRSLWRRQVEAGTIEKIVFTAEPAADVPAFVCLPAGAEPPYTWAICVQGHSTGMHNSIAVDRDDNTAAIEVAGDRDFALTAMAHGLAALCIEQRSFGERREQSQEQTGGGKCQEAACQALLLGRTLIGERVWDVDRGIDYLLTRDDVRADRIGVMGNSGGGTTTLFAAATLDRLAWAMPSCYFCTFAASIMSLHHCECNYVPGLLTVAEMADILGTFAPRPVVVVAGEQDPIFPIGATRTAFADLERIYGAFDAADRCRLVVGPEGHRFYAEPAWKALLELIEA
ncbi:MAG: alpha/beta hydrolase family protein [Planctomycetota bacterium]